MKLNLVPASTGLTWVRLGIRTFFRQPLAMGGLFFMFMAAVSVLSLVPLVGTALSVGLVPAATLGLMAATREAEQGRFPMPSQLVLAFRGGAERTRAMIMLGGLYAVGLLVVLVAAALLAGTADTLPATGDELTPEMVQALAGEPGLWLAMLVYLPVMMAFWHAPALVYWRGVSPGKSLFFSLMACWANKGALFFYAIGWGAFFMIAGLLVGVLGAMLGGGAGLSAVLYPLVLLMAAMFHTSIWFSVRDSFQAEGSDPPASSNP